MVVTSDIYNWTIFRPLKQGFVSTLGQGQILSHNVFYALYKYVVSKMDVITIILEWTFLPLNILFEYWIEHINLEFLHTMIRLATGICFRAFTWFSTECSCIVWCRGLNTCIIYVSTLHGNLFWKSQYDTTLFTFTLFSSLKLCFIVLTSHCVTLFYIDVVYTFSIKTILRYVHHIENGYYWLICLG